MALLRQALAFPMYAATVWLVWVVSAEAGPAGVLALGAALVAAGFAAWVLGLAQAAQRGRRTGYGLAAAGGIAALAALGWLAVTPAAAGGDAAPGSAAALPGAGIQGAGIEERRRSRPQGSLPCGQPAGRCSWT